MACIAEHDEPVKYSRSSSNKRNVSLYCVLKDALVMNTPAYVETSPLKVRPYSEFLAQLQREHHGEQHAA